MFWGKTCPGTLCIKIKLLTLTNVKKRNRLELIHKWGVQTRKIATETIKNIKVSFEDMPRILEVKSEMLNDLLAFNKDMISTKSRQLETVLAFKYN